MSFSLLGFPVAHLQVLFLMSAVLRASCVLPLLAVEDVERPPEGYRVVRALETRLPFRVFLDAYRLLQTRARQRNRNGRREGKPGNREHTAPERRDT